MSEVAAKEMQPRGFAGLTSLASLLPPAPPVARIVPEVVAPSRPSPASAPLTASMPVSTAFWTPGRKWITGIAVVGGLVAWSNLPNTGSHRPPYSPPPQYTPPPPQYTPAYTPPPQPQPSVPPQRLVPNPYQSAAEADVEGLETKPGTMPNQVFSAAEIRYCLSESVRLDALREAGRDAGSEFVSRFNSRVNDYNSRCINYRYQAAVMERIKSEVEANRLKIGQDAVNWDAIN